MWDVFISHASEDKDDLVRPLAKNLADIYGCSVWYDEFTLEYGDSLYKSIEKGLQNSNYGLVILSKAFIEKFWTDHEYVSLKTKEMLFNKKILIYIWYNITREEVAKYSYILADKYSIEINKDYDVDDLSTKIIKIIRPDIYKNLNRMSTFEKSLKMAKGISININQFSEIPIPPIRHEKLSIQYMSRLKIVYNAVKDIEKRDYNEYEEDFRRNTNLDREIVIIELLTAAYLDCINKRKMTYKEKLSVYVLILSLGECQNNLNINKSEINECMNIMKPYISGINAHATIEFRFDD